MTIQKNFKLSMAAIAASLLVAACGGGGGGSSKLACSPCKRCEHARDSNDAVRRNLDDASDLRG